MALTALAAILAVLLLWSVFGGVERSVAAPVVLAPGAEPLGDDADDAWQALAFVSASAARELAVGQTAEVVFAQPDAPARTLDASVLEVSSQPIATPAWFAELGLPAPAAGHLLRLALPSAPGAEDGTLGTVRVALRKRSFATLLLEHMGHVVRVARGP